MPNLEYVHKACCNLYVRESHPNLIRMITVGAIAVLMLQALSAHATDADAGGYQSAAAYAKAATQAEPAKNKPGMGLEMLQDEAVTYVDGNGMFTIAGNIKNGHMRATSPTLMLHIQDGSTAYSVYVPYGVIPAGGELPFKTKVPRASDAARLVGYDIDTATPPSHHMQMQHVTLDVVYDDTLILYPDGHLAGFAVNSGNDTLENPVLWAVVHGPDGVLDVARSEPLGTVKSGQAVQFDMYPDPAVRGPVSYYSCFAPSDVSVHPLTAHRGDQEYRMKYDSGAWLYRPVFGDDGTYVMLQTTNSYPFETYANVEIPTVTGNETFAVLRNDELINHTQSADETGTWHIAFEIRGHSQDVITIRGFEHGEILPVQIPGYIRDDLHAWALAAADTSAGSHSSNNTYSAKIISALEWLADHDRLPPLQSETPDAQVPLWIGMAIMWWHDSLINDDDVLAALAYAIESGIIHAAAGQDR